MDELYINIIGIIAGICTTVSFVPQMLKILQTGKTRDISLYMYVVLTIGIFLWMLYGILLKSVPIIAANSVSLVLCAAIVYKKVSNMLGGVE
ncbi:MAG: SemiSWEET transporter [Candidatus Omnitrophota bacterium]